jgi:chloramphenicol-sensitive protein RarD
MNRGLLAAAAAYILWGLLPIYWKLLDHIPALEILGHRVFWSFVVTVLLLTLRRNWHWVQVAWNQPSILRPFLFTALLLSLNWFTYIWATTNDHIVEASLGYFITPLVNVLLGFFVLRERLRPVQWMAIALAVAGVSFLTLNVGGLLWVSLTLALSFGIYGLLRKTARLGSLEGLSLEMAILMVPATGYLLTLERAGNGAFGHAGWTTTALLVGAGVVTAVPLLFFAYGAQRVSLTTLGILQYTAPTLQFLLGVLVYGESFTTTRLAGFSIIWLALLIYSIESYLALRQQQRMATSP